LREAFGKNGGEMIEEVEGHHGSRIGVSGVAVGRRTA
jgi:hypothetical protein